MKMWHLSIVKENTLEKKFKRNPIFPITLVNSVSNIADR